MVGAWCASQCLRDHSSQIRKVKWLGEEIEGTEFQGADGAFHIAMSRDDGDW
jgi:hypothetical protein